MTVSRPRKWLGWLLQSESHIGYSFTILKRHHRSYRVLLRFYFNYFVSLPSYSESCNTTVKFYLCFIYFFKFTILAREITSKEH